MTVSTTPAFAGREPSRLGDFFRYHGFWSPGVRLFRGIGFTHKATVIALTFVLPLAVLSWNYFNSQADQIDFSAKERLGVTYVRAVMPLLAQVQARRLSPASAPDDSAALRGQLAKLAVVERSLGEALGTAQHHREALAAIEPLLAPPAARDEAARKAQTAAMLALVNLLTTATDGSNLTLDPDIDSYYLMDAAMFRLPGMIDAAGQIGTDGATVLAAAQASPAQARGLIEQATLLLSNAAALEAGIAKSQAYNKDVATAVKPEAALTALRELGTQLDATALRPQGVQGDAAAHTERTQRATEAMLRLAADASTELDRLIVLRVQRLEASRDLSAVVLVLGLGTALYLFMAFGKVLHGGLREVAFHIDAMREGKLTTELRPWGRDEAAGLMHALVQMQQSLRNIVGRVRGASESIV